MKKTIFLFIALFISINSIAQFGEQQIITTNAANARAVFAADLDGDGDMDVLSASEGDNKVAWYENTDGLGTFGSQQIITESLTAAIDVYATDFDGDGDMDVIAASTGEAEVIWFENMDGLGNFGDEQIITNNANGVLSVFAIDIDSDGDKDVLAASTSGNKVAWYENTDGLGNFGVEQIITTSLERERVVFGADIDNDGDIDVITAYQEDLGGEVVWYENLDGLGNFSTHQAITAEVGAPRSVFVSDIDNDGDMDVLSASTVDYKIAWYENLTILGVEDLNLEYTIIYPNPATTVLSINNTNYLKKVMFYNLVGQNLKTVITSFDKIDITNLPNGLLFVVMETEFGNITKKVIKY